MNELGELKHKLALAQTPQEKVDALCSLALFLTLNSADYKTGLATAQEAYALSQSAQYTRGIAASSYAMSVSYTRLGQNEQAIRFAKTAVELYEQAHDEHALAKAQHCLGAVYSAVGEYSLALNEMQKSLSLRRKLQDRGGEISLLQNIGGLYSDLGNLSMALDCFQQALVSAQRTSNRLQEAMALGNIGVVQEKLGNYDKALDFHNASLLIFESLGSMYHLTVTHCNLGLAYLNLNRREEAMQRLQRSLTLSQETGLQYIEAYSYYGVGRLFLKAEPYSVQDCIDALRAALEIAERIQSKELIAKVYLDLSEGYARAGDFKQAFLAHKAYHAVNQEMFNEESDKRLKGIQAIYEVEQAKIEAEVYRLRNVELTKANQLKTELMSIAAHDLKNPLQSVMGFAQLVLEQLGENAEARHMVEIMHSAAQRMLHLVTDLLEVSALDVGELALNKETIDLAALAAFAIAECRAQASAKKQTIEPAIEPDIKIKADQSRMKDVFINLIGNAIKYSPFETSIRVSVERVDAKARFAVKDEGQGLTKDDMKRLFGRFQRLSAKPTGGESSTGLGLSIVKQLVELHGGTVWAESEGQGKGATFIVDLPIE